jgi:hypothetical protein
VQILKARNLPGTIELVHLDVSDEHSVGEAAKEVGEKFGTLSTILSYLLFALLTLT